MSTSGGTGLSALPLGCRPGQAQQLRRAVGRRGKPARGSRAGGEKGPGPRAAEAPPPARAKGAAGAPARSFLFASLPPLPPPSLPIWSGDTPDVGAARSPLPRTARLPGAADGAPRSPVEPRGAAASPAGRLPEPPGAARPATPGARRQLRRNRRVLCALRRRAR